MDLGMDCLPISAPAGLLYPYFSDEDKRRSSLLLVLAMYKLKYFDLTVKLIEVGVPLTVNLPMDVFLKCIDDKDLLLALWDLTSLSDRLQMKNQHKMTLLHEAVVKKNLNAVWKLLNEIKRQLPMVDGNNREQQIRKYRRGPCDKNSEWYTTINMKNKEGWTALHFAADRKFVDALQVFLMVEECDVTICNNVKQTAFHLAAKKGHLHCLELLLVAAQCSQSLNLLPKIDKNGWDLACHACTQNDVKVVEWLLKNMPDHADVNHSTKKRYTPLLIACYYQKIEILKFLLNHGEVSEIAAITIDGMTALHLAAMRDSVEITKLLLNKNFPIDQVDENGDTPLHIAYKKGSYQVWRLLLNEGADPNRKNKAGECPEGLKHQDLKIPVEIMKRGRKAVESYISALKKGKRNIPRCKFMIVGEAGVGKTNLLNLLTGEEFVPKHEKTEGIDIDLVSTHDISTETWKKSPNEAHGEYRNVAVDLMVDKLQNPTVPRNSKKTHASSSDDSYYRLQEQINWLIEKYTRLPESSHSTMSPSEQREIVAAATVQHESQAEPESQAQPEFQTQSESQPESETQPKLQQPFTQSPATVYRVTPPPHVEQVADQQPQKEVSVAMTSKQPSSVVLIPPPHFVPDVPSNDHTNITDISIIREASKKSKQPKSTQSMLPLKLTSFDFAGQKHYKPMHHCFITSRAIYVAAFNARQLVSSDQTVVNCSIQEIKFWINSIRVYTDAKLVLVGTHKGPYHGASGNDLTEKEKKPFPELSPQEIENINDLLEEHFDKDHCNLENFKDDKMMALVENSIREENDTSKSGAKIVRKKLKKLGKLNTNDLPISYLHLEEMIMEKRNVILIPHDSSIKNANLYLVHREELEQCAKNCNIDECHVALNFFHDIGIIIDPRNLPTLFLSKKEMKPLHDVVLIKPQWLADVMKELMNIDRGSDKLKCEGDDMKKALRLFKKEGKADKKQVLYRLWREYHNGSEKVFKQICLLLEAYGLIVSVQQSQCYYILCKLPQTVKGIPRVTTDCHKLCVILKDGLSPPYLLHHLMFLMYQRIQDTDDDDDNLFFDKGCYIEYVGDCQWWLSQSDPSDNIDVTIRTKEQVHTIVSPMRLLHRLILIIVEKKELKGIKYKLGPITKCPKCEEESFFPYITYDNSGDKPLSKIKNEFKCSECYSVVNRTEVIQSKNYKHPPIDHKDDKLDDGPGIRSRHVESSRENNPNMGTISSDTKAPRECKGDPSNQDLSHSYSQHYMVCTAAVLGLCALLCIVYIACGLL